MNCTEVDAKTESLFDGAASTALKADIETHFSGCPTCAIRLARLQAIRALLLRTDIPGPSPSLDEQLMRAFHDHHAGSQKRHSRWRSLVFGSVLVPRPALAMLSLAGLVMALLVGIQVGKKSAMQIVGPTSPSVPVSTTNTAPSRIPDAGVERRQGALFQTRTSRNPFRQSVRRTANGESVASRSTLNPFESFTTVSPSSTDYSTTASLVGFEPLRDTKIRVVKEEDQR